MLKIDGLEKRFGEKVLFRSLSLTVDGPAVLWAPSGWGKTTLLRILIGLEAPTAGAVQGAGRVRAVFQEDRLCPQLTALQNVLLVLPGAGERYAPAVTADFARLGMDAAALALPAAKLSGGQKRRTALHRHGPADAGGSGRPFAGALRGQAHPACHPRPGRHRRPGLAGDRAGETVNKRAMDMRPLLFPFYSQFHSSCARTLFCTMSPAGVRARVRPSNSA